jgi:hypothetical protein
MTSPLGDGLLQINKGPSTYKKNIFGIYLPEIKQGYETTKEENTVKDGKFQGYSHFELYLDYRKW